jgi:hypothetical protein
MMTMIMPSIALATGPYDWHGEVTPRAIYESRLARLREAMQAHGLTHAIVYGNTFDHEALAYFSNFTPKLGPALLFVPFDGAVRIVFSGGPGMKPSAQRLTWVEDVRALRGLEKEVVAWLENVSDARVGLVGGASILQGDYEALERGARGSLQVLDVEQPSDEVIGEVAAAAQLLQRLADDLFARACEGSDVMKLALTAERSAYAEGAQDVRLRIARKPFERPVTLPDVPLALAGPAPIALAVRRNGWWAYGDFVLGDIALISGQVLAGLEAASERRAYANRVSFPEPPLASEGLLQVSTDVAGLRFSALCVERRGMRDWLFRPPGL